MCACSLGGIHVPVCPLAGVIGKPSPSDVDGASPGAEQQAEAGASKTLSQPICARCCQPGSRCAALPPSALRALPACESSWGFQGTFSKAAAGLGGPSQRARAGFGQQRVPAGLPEPRLALWPVRISGNRSWGVSRRAPGGKRCRPGCRKCREQRRQRGLTRCLGVPPRCAPRSLPQPSCCPAGSLSGSNLTCPGPVWASPGWASSGLHCRLGVALGTDPACQPQLPPGTCWPRGPAGLGRCCLPAPLLPISLWCSGVQPLLPQHVCLVEKYQRVLMVPQRSRCWCFHSFPAIAK